MIDTQEIFPKSSRTIEIMGASPTTLQVEILTTVNDLKKLLGENITVVSNGMVLGNNTILPERVGIVHQVIGGGGRKGSNDNKKNRKRSDGNSINSQANQSKYRKEGTPRPESRNEEESQFLDEAGPATQGIAFKTLRRRNKLEREFAIIETEARAGRAIHGKVIRCYECDNIPYVRLSNGFEERCTNIRLNEKGVKVNDDVVVCYTSPTCPYIAHIFDLTNDRQAKLFGEIAEDVSIGTRKQQYSICGPRIHADTKDTVEFVGESIYTEIEEEIIPKFSKSPRCIVAFGSDDSESESDDDTPSPDLSIFANRTQIEFKEPEIIAQPKPRKVKEAVTEVILGKTKQDEIEEQKIILKTKVVFFKDSRGLLAVHGSDEKCYIDRTILGSLEIEEDDTVIVEAEENERSQPKYKAVKIIDLKKEQVVYQGVFLYWTKGKDFGFIQSDQFKDRRIFVHESSIKNPNLLKKMKDFNTRSQPINLSFTMRDNSKLQATRVFN